MFSQNESSEFKDKEGILTESALEKSANILENKVASFDEILHNAELLGKGLDIEYNELLAGSQINE